jgi:hypothetical protein
MTGETKRSAQKAWSLWPKCIGVVWPWTAHQSTSVGLKHVIELILNKQIVVFDWICHDSCYLKQSRDESLKNKTWFICWSETTFAVCYEVFLGLCTASALLNMQVALLLFPLCFYHHTSCDSCCCDHWDDKRDAVWKSLSQQPVCTSPCPQGTLKASIITTDHPDTKVLLLASYFLLFWHVLVPLDHHLGSHTSFTGSNTVYGNLLTVILFWWTYLVLKPSKIVLT